MIYIQKCTDSTQIETIEKQIDLRLNIKWLELQDYRVFCRHLKLCGQKPMLKRNWKKIIKNGTMYCGVFIENKMVSRAAVEKYSPQAWEVADVRTANEYRNNGYAQKVCLFVLKYILENNKNATIRTEDDNYKMKQIIDKLGFVPID